MKKKFSGLTASLNSETEKNSAGRFVNINRNSVAVFSDFGILCGEFIGTLGLLTVLAGSIFGTSTKVFSIGCILLFFSLILILTGFSERYETVKEAIHRQRFKN